MFLWNDTVSILLSSSVAALCSEYSLPMREPPAGGVFGHLPYHFNVPKLFLFFTCTALKILDQKKGLD